MPRVRMLGPLCEVSRTSHSIMTPFVRKLSARVSVAAALPSSRPLIAGVPGISKTPFSDQARMTASTSARERSADVRLRPLLQQDRSEHHSTPSPIAPGRDGGVALRLRATGAASPRSLRVVANALVSEVARA